ncbi:MAG: LemA family protein [Deltaproteobacteria bacterium]|nr:LemA family protein [Deltaproteobacteria bacterium]
MYVLLALALGAAAWAVLIYNRLVRNKNLVAEGWSGIDVQLKRRADLIPNLVDTVKGYMAHERGVLEDLTRLRGESLAAREPADRQKAEQALSGALGNIMALAENYPDLKASQNFLEVQQALAEVEDQIQLSRRYYNGAVREMNILVESFPSKIIADYFGFQTREFFELENPADKAVPTLKFS